MESFSGIVMGVFLTTCISNGKRDQVVDEVAEVFPIECCDDDEFVEDENIVCDNLNNESCDQKKIVELFQGVNDMKYFIAQWLYKAKDTVIKAHDCLLKICVYSYLKLWMTTLLIAL
ncbi:hypothetical protein H5410_064598 [Solanum commersonii]|uniref:Uncharacterized protein n=1 Tax=Solanum commersonii TaxID=4109 RepID=A0A9J5VYW1_SOLCO|nr:hypothetical protein H5410_064598 [Solanum commersonii]